MHGPRCRQKTTTRVFAIDPELNRVPVSSGVVVIEQTALGDSELLPHEVDPGNFLRNGMFHLQAGVDFQERDCPVFANQELAGSCPDIPSLFQNGFRGLVEQLFLLCREEGCRGFLHELLVSSLERTVSGGDHDNFPRAIGQTLSLHVSGLLEVFFDKAFTAAEGRDGFPGC